MNRKQTLFGKVNFPYDQGQDKSNQPKRLAHEITDVNEEVEKIIANTDSKKLADKIRALNIDEEIVNDTIVGILESDSELFVNLSQCITSFEREFAEFPQKIDSLLSIVSEISSLPVPTIDDIPLPPELKKSEILDQPAWLVNAPLMYDALLQQHRIEDSVALVVKCQNCHEHNIPSVSEWIDHTRAELKAEIHNRLSNLPINGQEARNEINQLKDLGFESDSMPLFLKLASKSLAKKMPQFKETAQFIPFITKSTQVLCQEIITTMESFFALFGNDNIACLTDWVTQEVSQKLPIYRNDIMPGNFAFMREAVKITQNELKVLSDHGVSLLQLFADMPHRFAELLELSQQQNVAEINATISEDSFDAQPPKKGKITLLDYPSSISFDKFKSHLDQFMKDFEFLYDPSIFFDCDTQINTVLLSYGEMCIDLLESLEEEEDTDDIDAFAMFRSISVQLSKVSTYLLPEVMKAFRRVTYYESPTKKQTEEACHKAIDTVCTLHVKYFFNAWNASIGDVSSPFLNFQWESTNDVDDQFEPALNRISEFIDSLRLPTAIYDKTLCIFLDQLLIAVKDAGRFIEDVSMLNSFDFHWTLFSQLLKEQFPREAMDQFTANVRLIEKDICRTNFINENETMTPMMMMRAVKAFIEADQEEEEEETKK
ncbi:hypothetical protein TVAG_178860 [Trichomonas vaginalis G3]|uniref:Exocyst component Exo84 C-terminal domain-containing protein n=1 Tax=Trichomonas vaginalis (strain ATCC PRA-98 / G3) TaxID=412133 RepID=A2FR57_TRIV3|nr:Cullin repeat-like family [Trichomonas vaginalis G3]EAX92609.1 hypothetical protein TVAG_178860 [Trichomonas vaginalis G3]KAI5552688.1 Cullin repeat-like family [Trichomonas vaginalis G3]|eukprot:XP_001305539.1 hypothetical protein [Trichomonas vaginalis G3]